MKEQIYIIGENGLIELNEAEFGDEFQFQKLLENYPNIISGNQIDPENPRKWILIDREVGIPSEEKGSHIWSLDHLFIDQEGIPTLVEVKRRTDTRIRREVVGQMLDYAANAVAYWSVDEIRAQFEKDCENKGLESDMVISSFAEDLRDADEFWDKVDTNLQAGRIRLLFVADKLPKELIRIIEFLNSQMSPAEVLGLELRHFANENIKTLVPRIVGKTAIADNKKGNRKFSHWNEDTFFHELKRRNGKSAEIIVRRIIKSLKKEVSRFLYGQGKRTGSIVPILDKKEFSNQLFAIYTYGKIEIYFQHYKTKPPFDQESKRIELLKNLNSIGLNIPESKIDKRPSFSITMLKDDSKLSKFVETYRWVIQEINKHQK